jgi:cytochrome c556
MIRKWLVFAVSAGILVSLGVGVGLSKAQDEKKSELHEIMENVQKHNGIIVKGIRTDVYLRKYRKDVEKSTKELVKLAKKAKPLKDALKEAKEEKDPAKKWAELMDAMIKETEKFGTVVAKPATTYLQAKDAFKPVTKSCSECHTIFRKDGEDDKF